jgi:hypothetical protein
VLNHALISGSRRLHQLEKQKGCSHAKVLCPGLFVSFLSAIMAVSLWQPPAADSACCYFTAKNQDVLQPAQKAFLTWDPARKVETFTVQPRFEGNARDFGMVIPTPGRPQLDEMPRDFFKELAVYTLLKRREYPQSRLLRPLGGLGLGGGLGGLGGFGGGLGGPPAMPRPPAVKVLEVGVVGALDYKILAAERADDLYTWLKDHKYQFAGDEATLDFYIKKKWFFTVMKIDAKQMKSGKAGKFIGELTPTRFRFSSDKLVYPLKITQISVKDRTEALFYVQAPYKVDLPGDLSYQYQWVPMLQNARGWYDKGTLGRSQLPGKGDEWLKNIEKEIPDLLKRGARLDFTFVSGQRAEPNRDGRTPTTLEWARRLTARDIRVLQGQAAFTESVPDVDEGFTAADMKDEKRAEVAQRMIVRRLDKDRALHPAGHLVREAPARDIQQLRLLLGHLNQGQFLTKFRKTFTKAEMDDDLILMPARLGKVQDYSEYVEVLPTSPP